MEKPFIIITLTMPKRTAVSKEVDDDATPTTTTSQHRTREEIKCKYDDSGSYDVSDQRATNLAHLRAVDDDVGVVKSSSMDVLFYLSKKI